MVETTEYDEAGKKHQKRLEIDFIARKGTAKYYIQSALNMDDTNKERSELRPLVAIGDSFKKLVVSKSYGKSWIDDSGILRVGLIDFLLDGDMYLS